jgi:hypothetical protein
VAQDASDETGIATDSKIVQTANGDLEVPATAHHVETNLGSFDEAEAIRQVGEEPPAAVETGADDVTPEVIESSEEAAALAHEVELEAAADSTAGGVVERVPIPAQFAHEADGDDIEDPEALLVIEREGAADGASSVKLSGAWARASLTFRHPCQNQQTRSLRRRPRNASEPNARPRPPTVTRRAPLLPAR